MSATLGKNGELERTTGVPHIERLKMPSELDKQNTGQRLFIFPNMSMDDSQARETTIVAVRESKRALILTPRTSNIPAIEQRFLDVGIDVLRSQDIKRSLDTFTSQENVVLVLANRYDGIDLPGDSCRLLILEGLPGGTNLQERFLLTRLAASSLLQDRIRTRLTQGVGRCCRNLNDYCGVLVIGQRILDFCARQEVRSGMNLELQAEIEFGISNSHEIDMDGVTDLLQLLYEQGDDWNIAGQEILNSRDAIATRKFTDKDNQVADILLQVVPHEVTFIYDIWKKDYLSALNQAVRVSDGLSRVDMTGYRAWWYYMAGCAAWLAGVENADDSLIGKAREFFQRAAKDSKSISWFAGLARNLETSSNIDPANVDAVIQCEAIAEKLTKLGFTGSKFSKAMSELLDLIQSDASISFDRGLQTLGSFFGFESPKPEGEAAPDAVWCLSNRLAIAFEAKREESASEPISIKTVRQALTHVQWVRSHRAMKDNARIFVVVVTSRSSIKMEAKQNAQDLYYIHPESIYTLANSLAAALRRVRDRTTPTNDGEIAQAIQEELWSSQLLLPTIIPTLTANRLNTLSEAL